MRWLVLRIRAPLAAFGSEAIDARGPTRDFPTLSALTGLLANALGYERGESGRLQALQDRLVFGARREAEPTLGRLTEYQTAQIYENDVGWTTRGVAEGREHSPSYKNRDKRGKWVTHQRWRDYHADARLFVVLTLRDPDLAPTLDDLAAALDRPARPLFFGRKPCLPAAPLFVGFVEAATARRALEALPPDPLADLPPGGLARAVWSVGEEDGDRTVEAVEARNWRTGLHGGVRRTVEGRVRPAEPAS